MDQIHVAPFRHHGFDSVTFRKFLRLGRMARDLVFACTGSRSSARFEATSTPSSCRRSARRRRWLPVLGTNETNGASAGGKRLRFQLELGVPLK